jgi:hypothetical protein
VTPSPTDSRWGDLRRACPSCWETWDGPGPGHDDLSEIHNPLLYRGGVGAGGPPATRDRPRQQLRHSVSAVAVGPDGRVVSGGDDGVVWLWDPAVPDQPGWQLARQVHPVWAVAVGPAGRVVSLVKRASQCSR